MAFGDQAIDLAALRATEAFYGLAGQGQAAAGPRLNALMACALRSGARCATIWHAPRGKLDHELELA